MTDPKHPLDKEARIHQTLATLGVKVLSNEEIAKDAHVVVGLPDDGTEYKLVPGSTNTQTCSKCGIAVWLAPSGREVVTLHPENTVQCLTCVRKGTQQ